MMRFIVVLGLVGLPLAGHADHPEGDAGPCGAKRHGDRVELTLTADEFAIPAYDARRGLVLVEPQTELLPGLDRQFAVKLRMQSPSVLMPLGPTGLFFGLESGARDLEIVVEAEPASPDCAVATRPACDELDVRALHLKRGEMIISTRRLDRPLEPPVRFETRVLEKVQIDRGRVDGPALGARGRVLGEHCLRKALARTRAIHGALTVEVSTTVLGEPEPARVVVDGLVHPGVSRCLIERIAEDAALWTLLDPAARAYVTLYFRGEAVVEAEADELESALNAP